MKLRKTTGNAYDSTGFLHPTTAHRKISSLGSPGNDPPNQLSASFSSSPATTHQRIGRKLSLHLSGSRSPSLSDSQDLCLSVSHSLARTCGREGEGRKKGEGKIREEEKGKRMVSCVKRGEEGRKGKGETSDA